MLTFAPVAVLLLALGAWTTRKLTDVQMTKVWSDQAAVLAHRKSLLLESIDNGLEKLKGFADDQNLVRMLAEDTATARMRLEDSFATLLVRNRVFDNVCWIDESGQEKICVDRRGGKVIPAAVKDLQDQSQRDYFRKTMRLPAGKIFISALELNVEPHRIKKPAKPILRLAMPVVDDRAHPRGIVMININADKLLDKIPRRHFTSSRLMLLDEEGRWLRSPDSEDERIFQKRRSDTFESRYPEVWMAMAQPNRTRFDNDQGLWTWSIFDPRDAELGLAIRQAQRWKLVSQLPTGAFDELRFETVTGVAPIILASLLISAFLIFLQARRGEQRMALELERETLLARLQRIASRIPGVIYEYQQYPDGRSCFPYASEAVWDIFRVTPDEVRNDASKVFARLYPEDLERVKTSIRISADALTPWIAEYRIIDEDGTVGWRSGNALPQKQADGSVLWHGFIHDITDRKKSEEALRVLNATLEEKVQNRTAELQESERHFRQITESLPQLVWTCGSDGKCDYLSRQWVEFTGIPAAEQLGFNWLEKVHPADRRNLLRRWKASVAAGTSLNVEYRIRRFDGIYHWFDGRAIPLRDEDGRIRKWFGSSTDITERKQAEQQMREHQQHYERLLKLEVASQTAAAIAHELNQPLNAASSYTDAALRFLDAGTPKQEQLRTALLMNAQQIQRGGQVIHELCRFLHDEDVSMETFDLCELVNRVLQDFEANDLLGRYTVNMDLSGTGLVVRADPLQIEKVLNNLIHNGIEAMRDAGMNSGSLFVSVRPSSKEGYAQVTVRDTGPGLSKSAFKRLFHPFSTTKPKGLGIGLAISRAMIHAQGGELWTEADAAPGAIFHFTIPYATKNTP